jgi:polyphosphate kinase 2 (PPK2 family)
MVLFDRSWYNRAGVEHVMGFCTEREYQEFMQSCPEFERMLVRSGIILIKYWFSVSDEEQERRFQDRMDKPTKRWKLSPMDLESRKHWADYSRAKDEMFAVTDTKQVPVVRGERREQESGAAERDPAPALDDSLQGPDAGAAEAAAHHEIEVRAAADPGAELSAKF